MEGLKALLTIVALFPFLGVTESFNFSPGNLPFQSPSLPFAPSAAPAPGLTINNSPSVSSPSGTLGSTGPGSVSSPNISPATSSGIGIPGTSEPDDAPAPSLPSLTIPKSKDSSIHFVSVEDGLWNDAQFDFNFGSMETHNDMNDKQCQSTCMDDVACVVAVLCTAPEEESTTTTEAPQVNFQPGLQLPQFNAFQLKSKEKELTSYNCHIFKEVADPVEYSSEDKRSLGSDCKYIAISPTCRNIEAPAGSVPVFDPILDKEHKYTQKFKCSDNTDLSISCGHNGIALQTGSCDVTGPEPGSSFNSGIMGSLPGLPSLAGAPSGSAGSQILGFSSRITCDDAPCHVDAICDDAQNGNSFTCTCKHGYDGNGEVCEDIDECISGEDGCGEVPCVNTLGGYECTCDDGFENTGEVCQDMDECVEGTHDCGQNEECTNTEGSFECNCKTGYHGDQCSDMDECVEGTHDCGQNEECTNTEGSFACNCKTGYHGDQCSDMDECVEGTHDCGQNEECTNTEGSFACTCKEGYHGDQCSDMDECVEGTHDCGQNEECTNTEGSFECNCKTGYHGDQCSDVDECAEGTHDCSQNQECTNTEGGFECTCMRGYGGDQCTDVDECVEGTDNCGQNQECMNTDGGFECTCVKGYDGDECSDIDECVEGTHDCGQNQECTNTEGGFECTCMRGYEGDQCTDINECDMKNTCNVNMKCENTLGSYVCEDIDECDDDDSCPQNSECVNAVGYFSCECHDGYDGDNCEDINECEIPNVCDTNMKCENIMGSYNCEEASGEELCTQNGYTFIESIMYCFKVHTEHLSYDGAISACDDEGGRLAILSTHSKLHELSLQLQNTFLNTDGIWVDATQTYYSWWFDYEINLWGDGTDVDILYNWAWNEPDSGYDMCVDMVQNSMLFRDESCDDYKNFICEKYIRTDCVPPFVNDVDNEYCFLILDEPMSRSQAKTSCPDSSRLAYLKTDKQINAVASYMESNSMFDKLWVGAQSDNGWFANYAMWDDGVYVDTDHVYPSYISKHCWYLDRNLNYRFDQSSCDVSRKSICEKPLPDSDSGNVDGYSYNADSSYSYGSSYGYSFGYSSGSSYGYSSSYYSFFSGW